MTIKTYKLRDQEIADRHKSKISGTVENRLQNLQSGNT